MMSKKEILELLAEAEYQLYYTADDMPYGEELEAIKKADAAVRLAMETLFATMKG